MGRVKKCMGLGTEPESNPQEEWQLKDELRIF